MANKLSIPNVLAVTMSLVVLTLLLGSFTADADEALACVVPSATYPTIKSAVDDASCDLINVAEGEFYERINITRPLTMQGSGADKTTINGGALGSVFTIDSTVVVLKAIAITNGVAFEGAGIHNSNTNLTISDCLINKNWASGSGGGIYGKPGKITVNDCVIEANEAHEGGGVFIRSGTMTISNSAVRDNESEFMGGGISHRSEDGEMILDHVSLKANVSKGDGAGIVNAGVMIIDNSSIVNNQSTVYSGGSINSWGTLIVNNSTISGNSDDSDRGGGIINQQQGTVRLNSTTMSNNLGSPALVNHGGDVRIRNTIIAANPVGDCRGTIHSDGYNLIGDNSGCGFLAGAGDSLNVAVNLGLLQGYPAYHPLLEGPGINQGDPDGCKDHLGQLLDTDQRGMPRVGRCDIGAYEYQGIYHRLFLSICMRDFCNHFFDDFADPSSGWDVGEDDYVRYGYLNGEYQVYSKISGYLYIFPSPACERNDIIVDVDARWEGAPGYSYGIVFNVIGNFDQYYVFGIGSNTYWLDGKGPAGWYTIINPTTSAAIRSGNQSNHLKVTKNGNQIRLEANGVHLQTVNDSGISDPGRSGLFSTPYSDRSISDARFDNFSVKYLPLTSASATNALHRSGQNTQPAGSTRALYQLTHSP